VIIAAGLISTQLGAVVGVAYLIAATLDPLVPKSYFRAAQIFNDRLLDPQKAKKILNGRLATYPDHDIIPFVSRYLGQMG